MRSDGAFIDGLQSRSDRARQARRSVIESPLGGSGDPLSAQATMRETARIERRSKQQFPTWDSAPARSTRRIERKSPSQMAADRRAIMQRRHRIEERSLEARGVSRSLPAEPVDSEPWVALESRHKPVARPVKKRTITESKSMYGSAVVGARATVRTEARNTMPTMRAAAKPAPKVQKTGNWLEDMWHEKKAKSEPERLEASEDSVFEQRTVKRRADEDLGLRTAKRHDADVFATDEKSENEYRRRVLSFASDDELEMDLFEDEFEDEIHQRRERRSRLKKEKPKKKHWFRRAVLTVLTLVVLAGGALYLWGDSVVQKMTGGKAGLFDLIRVALTTDGNAKFKTAADGRTNILLFGTSGYDMQGTNGDYVHDGAQLTDSIMVLSVAQDTGDMAMVSVQRDLYVGSSCMGAGKINEVYFCANRYGDDEESGAKALQKAVTDVLGLDLQYYVHVNWMALINIVDALGGVTVTLDETINDPMTGTYIEAGVPTNLNGEQALGLARARYGTVGGDFTRSNSQQKILMALKDRILEHNFSFTDLLNIANVLGDNIRMDFSAEEIAAAAKLATSSTTGEMRQINLLDGGTVGTGYIGGVSYVMPTAGQFNYSSIHDYITGQLNTIKEAESAKILVLNGSGMTGIAAAEREQLESAGFTVAGIGDAPAGSYFDKYYLYSVSNNRPQTLEKLQLYYNVTAIGTELLPAGIDTTDIDFVVILGVAYTD